MLNSNNSSTCPHNMAHLGPLGAEICWRGWGTPSTFQQLSRLDNVTARHSSSGRQPNFAALNRECHLYSPGRPPRWALAHILVTAELFYENRTARSTAVNEAKLVVVTVAATQQRIRNYVSDQQQSGWHNNIQIVMIIQRPMGFR